MLTVCQPMRVNQLLSALVENRGPSMTTQVPLSCTGRPRLLMVATAILLKTGQYGSAVETWVTTGPL